MKKVLMAFALFLIPMFGMAQDKTGGMKFTDGDFATIKAAAVKADKPIFMDIYTTWCPPCKFMSESIFPDAEVGKYMNTTFVNAKVDAEKGEGKDIAATYEIRAYPTMLMLDAQGKEIGRIVGSSRTPADFIKKVKTTLESAQKAKK